MTGMSEGSVLGESGFICRGDILFAGREAKCVSWFAACLVASGSLCDPFLALFRSTGCESPRPELTPRKTKVAKIACGVGFWRVWVWAHRFAAA